MDLSDRWPLPDSPDLRDELAAAYADPSRGYHDTRHLTEVLTGSTSSPGPAPTSTPRRCCWPRGSTTPSTTASGTPRSARRPGPRTRSRRWCRRRVVAEVARLVRLTETHQPDDADPNGCALSDADLAILAAPAGPLRRVRRRGAPRVRPPARRRLRARAGRPSCGALAGKPHLFHTAYAREHWEAPARANLERGAGGLAAVRTVRRLAPGWRPDLVTRRRRLRPSAAAARPPPAAPPARGS